MEDGVGQTVAYIAVFLTGLGSLLQGIEVRAL